MAKTMAASAAKTAAYDSTRMKRRFGGGSNRGGADSPKPGRPGEVVQNL